MSKKGLKCVAACLCAAIAAPCVCASPFEKVDAVSTLIGAGIGGAFIAVISIPVTYFLKGNSDKKNYLPSLGSLTGGGRELTLAKGKDGIKVTLKSFETIDGRTTAIAEDNDGSVYVLLGNKEGKFKGKDGKLTSWKLLKKGQKK